MKVMPISNNQPQFRAKFPRKELNTLVDAALSKDKNAGVQKLYTLLASLEQMPGEKAELKTIIRNSQSDVVGLGKNFLKPGICQLRIDGSLIEEGSNIYDMLYSAVTSKKTADGKKIPMPGTCFDTMWWENADKTYNDVAALLRD